MPTFFPIIQIEKSICKKGARCACFMHSDMWYSIMYLAEIISTSTGKYLFDAYLNTITPLSNQIGESASSHNLDVHGLDRDPFLPVEFNVAHPLPKHEYIWMLKNHQEHLVLCVTDQCNIRCLYCGYQDDRYCVKDYPYSKMETNVAFRAIEQYLNNSRHVKCRAIGFYGGEPLLNFELIKECVKYVENRGITNIVYSITTNGTLLDDRNIVDFLIKHHFLITISLDGPQFVHDRYRVDKEQRPTYQRIIHNLTHIIKEYPNAKEYFSFNAVLAPPINLDVVYDFFQNNKLGETAISGCTIGPFFRELLVKNKLNYAVTPSYEMSEFGYLYDYYLADFVPLHYMLGKKISSSIKGGGFCMPFTRKIYVSTSGNYYICEKVNEYADWGDLGNVFDGLNIGNCYKMVEQLHSLATERCRQCICANYCKVCFAQYLGGISEAVCNSQRETFLRQMSEYLEKKFSSNGKQFEAALDDIIFV